MPRSPRIALSSEALKALKLWAAMVGEEPPDLLSSLVLENLPSELRGLVNSEPPNHRDLEPQDHEDSEPQNIKEEIKKHWASGIHNGSEIARRIKRPRSTVARILKTMRDMGEIE
jgi:hypothetical protein